MALVPIHNVGAVGVVSDRPAHTLPPEAWTDSRNMRFRNRQARRMKGHTAVLGTPTVSPGFVLNVPAAGGGSLWVYGDTEHVYVDDSGVQTQITRNAGATPYTAPELWSWNTCLVGGVPILNNGSDVPQYWPDLSAGTDLADLTDWDTYPEADLRARVVRSFGGFLIALNTSDAAGLFPHRVIWSDEADPGTVPASWDVSDAASDAGQRDLTDVQSGVILDGLILGNQFIIYKENATHALRFVGGQEIMAFDFLFNSGIFATRCACLIDKGRKHFVVTQDDIIVHMGNKGEASSVVDEKVRERIFGEIEQNARDTCFVFDNAGESEAFFCYPTEGATLPNRAFVYNYRTQQALGFRDWQGLDTSYGAVTGTVVAVWDSVPDTWDTYAGVWQTIGGKALVIADPDADVFWQLELGDAYGVSITTAFLERVGLAVLGRDRSGEPKVDYEKRKQIPRVWCKLTGPGAASTRIQLGSQEEVDGTVTWTLPQTFNPAMRYVDFDEEQGACGRLNAIRFENSADAYWQLEGYTIEVNAVGEQ